MLTIDVPSADDDVRPSLACLQRLFLDAITAPDGIRAARRQNAPSRPLSDSSWLAGDSRLNDERLRVYQTGYYFRLLEVLRADFPNLEKLMGGEAFADLAADYIETVPSSHPSLRHFGSRMPVFITTHAVSRRWPVATELAALEWARVQAFDAPDATPLGAAALRGLPPGAWADLRLELIPSARLVEVETCADEIWRALDRGDSAPPIAYAPGGLIVWRTGFDVFHRRVDVSEARLLARLERARPFSDVCEELASEGEDELGAARHATELLRRWIADELLQDTISAGSGAHQRGHDPPECKKKEELG